MARVLAKLRETCAVSSSPRCAELVEEAFNASCLFLRRTPTPTAPNSSDRPWASLILVRLGYRQGAEAREAERREQQLDGGENAETRLVE
eukprot:CAMPEP_0182474414 /NCGR_PEP_ID=MMETSP1319-20130603/25601_1 /TAXON_ID=172717 /ORGANISM="Bolidomonas pacifica, Strain RCC208" /LENGTH=89 /DNA_ID=CAMNT_0024675297 /DNA_START=207 /DNA_END=476 /DNA_ORIENTATION=+